RQDVCSSAVEVAAIGFIAEEGDVAFRRRQRVGFPRKADRGDVNLSLHLTRRAHAGEAEVSGGSWIFSGSPVDFQTILKLMRAGVARESSAGQRGWSTTGTSRISRVKVLASVLMVRPGSGTGTTASQFWA